MNGDDCTQAISKLSVLPQKVREKATACATALSSDEKRDRLLHALQAAAGALSTMDAQEEALLHMMENLEQNMQADIRKIKKEEAGMDEATESASYLKNIEEQLSDTSA